MHPITAATAEAAVAEVVVTLAVLLEALLEVIVMLLEDLAEEVITILDTIQQLQVLVQVVLELEEGSLLQVMLDILKLPITMKMLDQNLLVISLIKLMH